MFSIPWSGDVPGSDKPAPPYEPIGVLEAANVIPTPNEDDKRPWSQEALKTYLESHPDSSEALWESILTLWHLKKLETNGKMDRSWQKNTKRWLVSSIVAMGAQH